MTDSVSGDSGHILLFALDVIVKVDTNQVITATAVPAAIPDLCNILFSTKLISQRKFLLTSSCQARQSSTLLTMSESMSLILTLEICHILSVTSKLEMELY